MKSLVVLANCQGGALAKTMLESTDFSAQFRWDEIPAVHVMKRRDIREAVRKTKEADVFVYQHVVRSPYRPKKFTSEFFLRHVKKNAVVLSYPSLYFDGYFPHLHRFQDWRSVISEIHDYFMAYASAVGMDEQRLYSLIQEPDFYPKDLSVSLAEESIQNLERREEEHKTYIQLSKFIRDNYKIRKEERSLDFNQGEYHR